MKKIKILYLITGLTAGGAEIMLKRIVFKLNPKKYEIIVCSLINETDLVNSIKKNVKKIYILNNRTLQDCFSALIQVRKIIQIENPHILHCFMPHANLIGRFAAIGFRCKVISSLWVVLLKKKYLNFFDNLTQRLVDLYTVNSNSLQKFAIKCGLNSIKIKVVESGLDFEKFRSDNKPEELKKELNLFNLPILTMIAHLRKQKDYPTMIHALAYLQKEIEVNFLLCGYGNQFEDETQKIKQLIKDLNLKNVKLLGFREDIPDILAITDIWVSSTLYEGQSNSLLEAMAMKKPIITTNIPENAEVVRNGIEALLVPIKSPKILAYTIKKLINDKTLAKELAENAYKRVKKKYHINNTIMKLQQIYDLLIN